ncbi:cop9 signalosome complex subunit [Anaeramoeba flamelloides]|uniref:COP9 signalosome complex subunit 4 n=1 Tax=Anaeramoeba flamelloides TaxID=1746091 RepID=A0AAV7ZP82_9EUKA|nr:cop9 signalosome complex subunit [Anaeramoeba flamelloides]
MSIEKELKNISGLDEQKDRSTAYSKLLNTQFEKKNLDALKEIVSHISNDQIPLIDSRPLMREFAEKIKVLEAQDQLTIGNHLIECTKQRVTAFDEPLLKVRRALSDILEEEEEFEEAAKMLIGIQLQPVEGEKNEEICDIYVKIAQLYLENAETVEAERYLRRSANLIKNIQKETLVLRYKSCYARILDSNRKFLEASINYYHLSHKARVDEVAIALTYACNCAILAKAGPSRSRMLATLFKDERCSSIKVYHFLEKVYLERILRTKEVEEFASTLKEHQLAKFSDGTNVLTRSVMEHNLLAASKLYKNISIKELGRLLGIEPERAEKIASKMIQQKRLSGSIDQLSGMIEFEKEHSVLAWDRLIENLCTDVNNVVEELTIIDPKLVKGRK